MEYLASLCYILKYLRLLRKMFKSFTDMSSINNLHTNIFLPSRQEMKHHLNMNTFFFNENVQTA